MSDPQPEAAVLVASSGRVGTLRLNQPDARNALSQEVLGDLVASLEAFDADPAIGCIVIAGSDKVFASGADIRLLAATSGTDAYFGLRGRQWQAIRRLRTPIVAAVSGYCLGGGCELALACDIIVASDTAKFGLPETGLGLIPGAGGTQMLTRALGKTKAMDVILSGRLLSAAEAEQAGLVARVAPAESWLADAQALAAEIARRPAAAIALAKEAVAQALDLPLEAGIEAERRAFAIALGTEHAREGLAAFLEKREPRFDQPTSEGTR